MRRFVIAVLVGIAALMSLMPAPASADPASDEAAFVSRINSLRASKGLAGLAVDGELTSIARQWAAKMAADDAISHNPNFSKQVQQDWLKLGENVGVGMSVDSLFDAFVDSPSHYRNLVDPDFRHVGVGVVIGRDGAIFTAHQFMKLADAPAPAPAPTPAPAPAAAPAPAPRISAPAPAPAPVAAAAPVPLVETTASSEPAPVAAPPVPPARVVYVLEQLPALFAA